MVVDTTYYDVLCIQPTAGVVEIKKAYRQQAVLHHPDKNPGDAASHARFQVIGEAYQVLSDPELRKHYDKYGKDFATPKEGFVDPAEFLTSIFGGECFYDWIGEISTSKDIMAAINITNGDEDEDEFPGTDDAVKQSLKTADAKKPAGGASAAVPGTAAGVGAQAQGQAPPRPHSTAEPAATEKPAASVSIPTVRVEDESGRTSAEPAKDTPSVSGTSTPRRTAIPIRPALMDRPSHESDALAEEKELRRKEKKKGLSKEQKEQLHALEVERQRVRNERIEALSRKLIDRVSIWTETNMDDSSTAAFKEKIHLEAENLKMESFGVEILQAIAHVYGSKAGVLVRSQNFLGGIGGFFSRIRDKGTLVKETWHTISSAIDAQQAFVEMERVKEEAGEEWTNEAAEYERRTSAKVLNAVWRMSKSEITSVLRAVCDSVLSDKKVHIDKRIDRAKAMLIISDVFAKTRRTAEEEGDYMAWEQLVAEAAIKKEKESKRKGKDQTPTSADPTPGNIPTEKPSSSATG